LGFVLIEGAEAMQARPTKAAILVELPGGVRVEGDDRRAGGLGGGGAHRSRRHPSGMNRLALQVQEALKRNLHAGDLYVFRQARRPDQGPVARWDVLSLYAKRLDRLVRPVADGGPVKFTPGQLGYMLEGIDWRKGRGGS
jgi:transposase